MRLRFKRFDVKGCSRALYIQAWGYEGLFTSSGTGAE
jgi:hypothetical protein